MVSDSNYYYMMMRWALDNWAYYDDMLQHVGRYSKNSVQLNALAEQAYKNYEKHCENWLNNENLIRNAST